MLRERGPAGLRIDALALRLGLTKGSFHHHFKGIGDYRRALLKRYEDETVASIDHAAAAVRDLSPTQAIAALPMHVSGDHALEAAVRGWGMQEPDARDAMSRIDEIRLRALTDLWQTNLSDARRARIAALIPHLIAIGASAASPRPTADDLDEVFALLAVLVSSVPGSSAR